MNVRLTGLPASHLARPRATLAMVLVWLIAVAIALVPLSGVSSADEPSGAEAGAPEPEPATESVAELSSSEAAEETAPTTEPDEAALPVPDPEPTTQPTEGPAEPISEPTTEPTEDPTEEPEPLPEPADEPTDAPDAEEADDALTDILASTQVSECLEFDDGIHCEDTDGLACTYYDDGRNACTDARPLVVLLPPATPTGVTATAGDGQVTVSWDAVEDTEEAPVTEYRIYRDQQVLVTSGTSTWVDTGLDNGVTYTYQVSAVGPGGESGLSEPVSATPQGPPPTPTGVTVTPGVGLVVVAWTPLTDAAMAADATVAGYRVYRDDVLVQQIADPTSDSWTDTGLPGGTTYTYQVASYGPSGESPRSSAVTVTTDYGPPATPSGVGANRGNAQVTVSWSAVASTSTAPVTGYRVYRDGALAQEITGEATTSWTDTGRTNGTTYTYQVSAYGPGGESARSGEVTATPTAPAAPVPGAPPAPTGVSATVQDGGVLVTWDPVPSTEEAPVSGYRIFRDGVLVHEIEDPNASSWLDTDATSGSHTYEVVAFGPGGQSPGSTAVVDTTPPPHNPDDPGPATARTSTTTVRPGEPFIVEGEGWLPGTQVTIEIFSAPLLLATANVDEGGTFRTQVSLPSNFPPGNHTLVMSGLDRDGLPRRVSIPMTVLGLDAEQPAGEAPVVQAGTVAPAPAQPGQLAATGASAGILLVLAFLMVGTGVAALRSGRRRSRYLV